MARRRSRSRSATSLPAMNNEHGWYAVKGIILLILGLLLWRGTFSLDLVIAILLVLGGIKFLLKPLYLDK